MAFRSAAKPKAPKKPKATPLAGCEGCILTRECGPDQPRQEYGDILVLVKDANSSLGLLQHNIPSEFADRLIYGYCLQCPTTDKKQAMQASVACRKYLYELLECNPQINIILGMGDVALSTFMAPGVGSIMQMHGVPFPVTIGERDLWYYPILDTTFVSDFGGIRGKAYPVFRIDLAHFWSDVVNLEPPRIEQPDPAGVIWAQTYNEAKGLIAGMERPYGLDIETTTLHPCAVGAMILTAAVSDGNTTVAWSVQHPEGPTNFGIKLLLEVAGEPWIAHNASFEYMWLRHYNNKRKVPVTIAPFHDTIIMGRIYHERSRMLGLDVLSQIHLGVDVKALTTVNVAKLIEAPLSEVLPYNGLDAWASAKLFHKLYDKVNIDLYNNLLRTTKSTAIMTLLGLPVDLDAATELEVKWKEISTQALASIKNLPIVRQFETKEEKEFNPNSTRDLGKILTEYGGVQLERTKTQFCVDEAALTACKHPLAKLILAQRGAAKMASTYISPIKEVSTTYADGLLHPHYTVVLTATLRLSANTPNIQNFPKRTKEERELRRMVTAPPGCLQVSFDYKALEAVVIAMLTNDKNLRKQLLSGEDFHSHWRDRILHHYPNYIKELAKRTHETDEAKILKYGRDVVKTDFVFEQFFGGGIKTSAERTGAPLHILEKVSNEFWEHYRDVRKWIDKQRLIYQQTGCVNFATGLVRYDVLLGNEPINNPIQGAAIALVLEGMNEMVDIAESTGDPYLFPRLNIHDDLQFFLPADERLYEYCDLIGTTLVKQRFPWQTMPLSVNCAIGSNWYDLEDCKLYKGEYNE
jgi:DNA polymerase I-like protein with 3'-5' exonuclease and polymerase domains